MTLFIKRTAFAGVFVVIGILGADGAQAAEAKKTIKITFEERVLPILRDKCIGCHSPDKARSGLVVTTYPGIMAGGSSGAVIKAGDPDNSRLFLLVAHKQEPFMPPKSAMLPADNLETIKQWIAGGALENSGSKAKMVNKPKVEIALSAINKGKPEGPPPMPSQHLSLEPIVHAAHATAVTAIASSPWAPLLAVAGQKQVLLYQSDTLDLLGVLPFPEGVPYVLKFSRNGSLLLAGGGRGAKSGRAVVWSVHSGERIFEVGDEGDAVLAADISADQTQIALGGPGKIVRIFSTKDGQLLREIKKHTDWVTTLEYSPDGVLLATGDRSGGLYIWEAYTGREYFSLRGHTASITAVSWRRDSNALASGSEDTTIRLWEMENGGQIKAWGAHGGGVESVRFAHDGRIASCGRDQVTRVWDQNGAQQKIFEAFPDIALRTTFTHDGNRVVAGDWTGSIRVWNVADAKQVGLLSANPPGLAAQLEAATKDLAALEAAQNKLAAAAALSREAAQKATADLAATQKALAGNAAATKAASDALNKAKDAAAKAASAVPQAQALVAARELSARALAEAAAKVKDAAAKAKDNKALAEEAAKCQEVAARAAADLAAAQKSIAELTVAAKTATEDVTKSQQALTALNSTIAALPKQVEAKAAVAIAAAAKAATDKAAVDQGAAALNAARARVDKLRAALQAAPAVARN